MKSLSTQVASCLANNVLRLIVLPTEACNFRCTYCYEEFEHGRMHGPVVAGLKRFIARRAPDLDTLTVSWFGGEPLLARDLVEDVMTFAQATRETHMQMRVHSDMTTNAFFLSRQVFRRLLDLGVGAYQISLDGTPDVHDRTRVLAGGRGTFQRIWDNLEAMRNVDDAFDVLLRVHVHRDNLASLPQLFRRLADAFAGDARFRVLLKPLAALGGPCDGRFPYLEPNQTDAVLARLRPMVDALGLPQVRPGGDVCYAARGNAFVVRADGRVNKCTVALEHPANQVGRLHEDGRLQLHGDAMQAWMRGIAAGDEEALRCPMKGLADVEEPAGQVSLRWAS